MRSHSLLLIVGLVLMSASFLLVVSCSNDDPVPTQIIDEPVTIDHDQYETAQLAVDEAVSSAIELAHDGVSMFTASVADLGYLLYGPYVPEDSSTPEWTIFFLLQSGTQIRQLDSIQFSRNGVPQVSGFNADMLEFKHYWQFVADDTTVTHTNVDIHGDFTFSGIDNSPCTVNGIFNRVTEMKNVTADSTVWWRYEVEAAYSNYTVAQVNGAWETGCPSNGSCTMAVALSYKKDQAEPVTSQWTFEITFTDGNMEVDVTQGTDNATYNSQACTIN